MSAAKSLAALGTVVLCFVTEPSAAGVPPAPASAFDDSLRVGADLLDRGEYVEAEALGRRLLGGITSSSSPDSIALARSLDLTALALRALGMDSGDEPASMARSALEILERHLPAGDFRIGYAAYVFGQLWGGTNRPERGRELLARALDIQRQSLGPNDPAVAATLEAIAWNRSQTADFAGARSFAEQSLDIRKRALGADHPALAGSITVLGFALRGAGEPGRARTQLDQALAIREQAFGHRNLETASSWMNLGFLGTELARYAPAESCYRQALDIREAILGPVHPLVGTTLVWIGNSVRDLGNTVAADSLYQRAIRIGEMAGQPNGTLVGDALLGVSWCRIMERRPAEAREAAERVLAIREAKWGPDHPSVAYALERLGDATRQENKFTEALRYQERALEIRLKALGPRHGDVGRSLKRIGDVRGDLGDLLEAREAYESALSIEEEIIGPNSVRVATIRFNLGIVLSELGDPAGAREQWERAYRIYRDRRPDSSIVGAALSALATTWRSEGNLERARELTEQALESFRLATDLDSAYVAGAWQELGSILRQKGDLDGAESYLVRALATVRESIGTDQPTTAAAMHDLAALRVAQGRVPEALALCDTALAVLKRVNGNDHPNTGDGYFWHATVLRTLGRRREALEDALEADRIGRPLVHMALREASEERAITIAAQQSVSQSLILDLMAEGAGDDSALVTRACDALVRSRASVLDEVAARHRSVGQASAVVRLADAFAKAQQRYANLMVRGSKDADPTIYRGQLERARREAEEAEQALSGASGSFREGRNHHDAGLDEVLAAMPRGAALVAFWRYRTDIPTDLPLPPAPPDSERYLAIVVPHSGERPRVVPLGAATEIDTLVAKWRAAMWQAVVVGATGAEALRGVNSAGAALRERIWAPLAERVASASRIFIVPDAALHLVSFGALPAPDGTFLVEGAAALQLLSAERDLIPASGPAGSGLLVVGGPSFEAKPNVPVLAAGRREGTGRSPAASRTGGDPGAQLASAAPFRSARSGCEEFRSVRFPALPGTSREMTEISGVWRGGGGGDVVALSGAGATEGDVKREAVAGKRVIHFATHGFFLGGDCSSGPAGARGIGGLSPMDGRDDATAPSKVAPSASAREHAVGSFTLLLSGLALAGANHRDEAGPNDDDGILTAEEIAALDLSGVEWVVLSACETGLGRTLPGEGVFGMRRAFQVAGARTLIMSLWPVEDAAARQWMRELYSCRFGQGLDTAAAVRAATLKVLSDRRARGQSLNPFYWSAFVAAGDWK